MLTLLPRGADLQVGGLLPPIWWVPAFAVAGAVVALRWTRLPAGLLVLPLVAVLPWLGPALPALLIWSGPSLLIIWTLVVTGAVLALGDQPRVKQVLQDRRGTIAVALVAGTVMSLFAWAIRPLGTSGDEPHYLLITTSVLRDADLDLSNDYAEERHLAFYPGPLTTRHVVLSSNGREYSFHGHGVAALTLPAFTFGGVAAVRLTLIAISSLGIAFLFSAARRASASGQSALAAIAALVLSTPLVAQSAAIYPDGPAAAIVSLALLTCIRLERQEGMTAAWLAGVGAALAFLPWLHLRYSMLAAAFGLAVLWLMRHRRDAASDGVVFLAAPVVSATLLFASSWVMFDTLDPTAAFRQKATGSLAAAPSGMLGLLADHEYGLLPYAPAFAFAALGAAAILRQMPATGLAALFSFVSTLVTGASFVWWGGTTSPARFLVSVLPVLTLCIAIWWTHAAAFWRAFFSAATATGGAITLAIAMADGGGYVINEPDARHSIFEWANGIVDLPAALPSMFRPMAETSEEALVAMIWLVVGVCVVGALAQIGSRRRGDITGLAAWGLTAWITASATLAWSTRGVEPRQTDRAQLEVLQAASRPWLTTGLTQDQGITTRDAVLGALRIAGRGEGPVALLAPRVPAGQYRILVEDVPASEGTHFSLELGRNAWPLQTWLAGDQPPTFTLALPIHSVRVVTNATAERQPTVRLRPEHVLPASDRPTAVHVTRYGDLDVYALDSAPTMETGGFWLPGNRRTAFVVTDRNAQSPGVTLMMESAEGAGVRVSRESWHDEERLAAGQRATFVVPAVGDLSPLYVDVTGAARQGIWVSVARR